MKKAILSVIASLTLLYAGLCQAFITQYGDKIDDPDVKACFTRVAPEATIKQVVVFNTSDGEQSTGTSGADIYWRYFEENDSRVYVRVTDPPARSGVGLLILENEEGPPGLHMYLPELRSVRRITGQTLTGSMLGTDFSYEDFMQVYGLAPAARIVRTADQVVEQRSVYVTEMNPADPHSAYQRIEGFIDKEWCIPVRIDFYADDEQPVKTLTVEAKDVKTINDRHIPIRFMMFDHVNDTRTEVVIEKIEVDREIRDGLFTIGHLRSGR